MSITLDTITLPKGLIWLDEFDWTPVQQSIDPSIEGVPIVQAQARTHERPITLVSEDDSCVITRAELETLNAKKITAVLQMTLTLHDARVFTVLFRQNDTPVEARPLISYTNPGATDVYVIHAVRFVTIPTPA